MSAGSPGRRWVALIGNPNTGKTTVFNRLTGFHARTGNYPGVTVEKRSGPLRGAPEVEVLDLPGTYSLAARSADEAVAVDVLLGRRDDTPRPDAVVVVVDATNLERNLYLVTQILELGLPTVVALTMVDLAEKRGLVADAGALARRLGVPVVAVVARRGAGIETLRQRLLGALVSPPPRSPCPLPAPLTTAAAELAAGLRRLGLPPLHPVECRRALVDAGGIAEARFRALGPGAAALLADTRAQAGRNGELPLLEAAARYAFIEELLPAVLRRAAPRRDLSERLDRILTHRGAGLFFFVLVMTTVFLAIFAWAAPFMDLVDRLCGRLGAALAAAPFLGEGALKSLLVDGVVAGVGNVLVFLPQIMILFFFLSLLEDCGYLARAAFLMDRLLRWCGLSGKALLPLLSCFACAVPGILATRTIESRRERMVAILVAPLFSCSARIPVYALFTACFVPPVPVLGFLNLQALVFAGMYFVGLLVAVPAAWLFRRFLFRETPQPMLLELPPYRLPSLKLALAHMTQRSLIFLRNAGTIILAVSVLVWALCYFPLGAAAPDAKTRLEGSAMAALGKLVGPAVAPIGWDWRVGMAILASFPARELVVATLGVISGVGEDTDAASPTLRARLRAARRPDGGPLFTLASALALMVFFALCAQCASTLAVIRRETGTWRWAVFAFLYLTTLAYLGALGTAAVVRALGGG